MKNVYRISWSQSLNSCSGKLRTYSKFKNTFCLENYIIQFPLHIRRNLTKLRISSHNLAIETGRYVKNKNSLTDKRHCFHCKTIESEFHFMIECTLYSTERKKYFDELEKFTSIRLDSSNQSFHLLMSCLNGDLEVGRLTCEFINKCFEIRREAANIAKEKEIFCRPQTTTTRSGRTSKRPLRIDV